MMLTLYVFPGNEFTASIDAGSLQLIAYLRLLGDNSPVHVVSTCNHLKVPTRSLPTLVIDGVTYSGVDDILKEFRKQGLSIDELTEVELAEVFAYQSMLADRLKLPLLYLHWLDGKNYTDVTRKWIGQMSSFPLSQYILSSQHRSAKQLFDSSLQHITKLEQKELELINQAEETLNLLNARLQKRLFFFGTKACSLDALVFGYLELIAQYSLPGNNRLQATLRSSTHLWQFCQRMREMYFPEMQTRTFSTSSIVRSSVPFHKDPVVLMCLGLACSLMLLQTARVGLLKRFVDFIYLK